MSDKDLEKDIGHVIESMAKSFDDELKALSQEEIAAEWYWQWEEDRSIEWNTYEFFRSLELHKNRCRRWEEHHNGAYMVVERVRDKYVMPRIREFLEILEKHMGNK